MKQKIIRALLNIAALSMMLLASLIAVAQFVPEGIEG